MDSDDNSRMFPLCLTLTGKGPILLLHVQPGAKKDAINGYFGDRLKVSLNAPPVDGKANAQLIKYFSKLLKLPKRQLTITAGETSRDKSLLIDIEDYSLIFGILPSRESSD